jgi:hypothetical protein
LGFSFGLRHHVDDDRNPHGGRKRRKNMYNRFAEKRRRYLREYRDGIYTGMLLTGKLDEHLKEIGDTAQEMFDQLVEQTKKAEGVTERLKTENQMEWVGRMNSICSRAEEVVLSELVYC